MLFYQRCCCSSCALCCYFSACADALALHLFCLVCVAVSIACMSTCCCNRVYVDMCLHRASFSASACVSCASPCQPFDVDAQLFQQLLSSPLRLDLLLLLLLLLLVLLLLLLLILYSIYSLFTRSLFSGAAAPVVLRIAGSHLAFKDRLSA